MKKDRFARARPAAPNQSQAVLQGLSMAPIFEGGIPLLAPLKPRVRPVQSGDKVTDLTGATFQFGTSPFYFVRHGETDHTERGIVQGQEETVLNDEGRLSAWKAATLLAPVHLGSIYSSPLRRAWETAAIISRATALPVTPLPGLMERNWGEYQGKYKDLRPRQRDPDGVESTDLFWLRIVAAMKSIVGPLPVLVVAHSGVFRLLCDHAGMSVDARNEVANGVVFKFDPSGRRGVTWRVEAVSH